MLGALADLVRERVEEERKLVALEQFEFNFRKRGVFVDNNYACAVCTVGGVVLYEPGDVDCVGARREGHAGSRKVGNVGRLYKARAVPAVVNVGSHGDAVDHN